MKKEKAKLILTALASFALGSVTVVGANQAIKAMQNTEIKVKLDGIVQTFKDETTGETQYPITYNNRTYLPLRTVANLVGVEVDYDEKSNTAILKTSDYISKEKTIEEGTDYELELLVPSGPNLSLLEIGDSITSSDSFGLRNKDGSFENSFILPSDPNMSYEIVSNPHLVEKKDNGVYIAIAEGSVGIEYSYLYKGKVYKTTIGKNIRGKDFSNGDTPVINTTALDLNMNETNSLYVYITQLGSFAISYPEGYNEDNYYKYEWSVEDENIVKIKEASTIKRADSEVEVIPAKEGKTTITCNISTVDGKESIKKIVIVNVTK